jgi:formiminotetrahydrofolate cyclodeaminase
MVQLDASLSYANLIEFGSHTREISSMLDGGQNLATTPLSIFFDAAASTEPTPGGGCVSAVCGYLAIALLLKSIRISARKQPSDTSIPVIDRKLIGLSAKLLVFAQADSDSFGAYIQALRLPKDTPEREATRKQALHDAIVKATETALDILDLGNDVLDLAHQVQFRVSTTIRTDEQSCVELISAMNTTAQKNALANMTSIEGVDLLRKRLSQATTRHTELLTACHSS